MSDSTVVEAQQTLTKARVARPDGRTPVPKKIPDGAMPWPEFLRVTFSNLSTQNMDQLRNFGGGKKALVALTSKAYRCYLYGLSVNPLTDGVPDDGME
jgi:hypothetical protein